MILLLALACRPGPPEEAAAVGSLVVEQIAASGPSIGEGVLVVGPDGTSALIDVANDAHEGAVREAVLHHVGSAVVDWVILTHFHRDHVGGFEALFDGDDPVRVRRGVVVRGEPIGDGASGDQPARIDEAAARLDVPVTRVCGSGACDLPLEIPLGEGAVLTIALANGSLAGADGPVAADVPLDPDTSDGENARSLGGFVAWGAFAYVFAGDLTGGGKDTPDVESFVAEHAGAAWPAEAEVLHLDHHGIQSSTNPAWVARWLGAGTHHGLVGSNGGYLDAPDEDVLDRLAPALGGGKVWAVDVGLLTGDHDALDNREESVVVTVSDGGDGYAIQSRTGDAYRAGGTFSSNP